MDPIKGAEMLGQRFVTDGGSDHPRKSVSTDIPREALPLFHWLGVQPHEPASAHVAVQVGGGRRFSRRRRR